MPKGTKLLSALGGEAGCQQLSKAFYSRVARDPILHPLFPGKSLRCATEEFAAFLIQFLGGDEEQTQHRWWLSLQESHARFRISPAQRRAWLTNMEATLQAIPLDQETRSALTQFFNHSSRYVAGHESDGQQQTKDADLAACWAEQRTLDDAVAAIVAGRDREAMELATTFLPRPSVFVGLLARMMRSGCAAFTAFVIDALQRDPSLATRRFAGATLLHYASSAGCLEVVRALLRFGTDPNIRNRGNHTPLYCVANECTSEKGPDIVRALVQAGGDVNACLGVTRATPLHMAARRGNVAVAQALLDSGAAIEARDRKGDTPLLRAINCRKENVAKLLVERGAVQRS